MQIGIDSFAAAISDPATGQAISAEQRLQNLLEEIELADQAGVAVFGVGEHHRREFLDSAPAIILAAAAARTRRIRLTSAVTVLSADDPVRVFQNFATIDLISNGRVEMVVGRGSFTEAFPLFGFALEDYDDLFEEKLALLLKIRKEPRVEWSGRFRPRLAGQEIYPRPVQNPLPVWLGVGGTPQSFVRAGLLGLPLMIAIIGGEPRRFKPLVDLYWEAGRRAGHDPKTMKVGLHCPGFVGETAQQAADDFYPGFAHMFSRIGQERGHAPFTRANFDRTRGRDGAYFIGDPNSLVDKILSVSDALGGVSRISFQMTNVMLPHAKMLRSIELMGSRLIPLVQAAVPVAALS